ncbi:hypothetical protein [Taibaiella sp. KBW10]|uniref:hypothetical protein n=1 Tax=Taibaiella sp. KBW10 TaxID=2153357 RepID=UPI000F5A6C04|nr:hypothetical protein [Taibaiella sp. KBW10]
MMKNVVLILIVLTGILSSCSKKESGVCYCSYFSGDRTHYDLKGLDKQKQIDSCNRLSELASGFAGSCKLKK